MEMATPSSDENQLASMSDEDSIRTTRLLGNEFETLKIVLVDGAKLVRDAFLLAKEKQIVENQDEISPTTRILPKQIGLSENIKALKEPANEQERNNALSVVCRCRPLNQSEIEAGACSVVTFDLTAEKVVQITSKDNSSKRFYKFDHVVKPEDGQDTVFALAKPIVTSVLSGYNACVFSYGQTGTGKTYTMEGTSDNRGIFYNTLDELFICSKSRSRLTKFTFSVSMFELCNEQIKDLLAGNKSSKNLQVRRSLQGTEEVLGLVEHGVHNTDGIWELISAVRKLRSHAQAHFFLRVTVREQELRTGLRSKRRLWLVDLAGSEGLGQPEVEGEWINKSLSALGDVLSSLESKTSHIPYRKSKLTHILQSSLGGDSKIQVFVHISPNPSDFEETVSSLKFATRVGVIWFEVLAGQEPIFSSLRKRYREMVYERSKFQGSKEFSPLEPQNPLGAAYDCFLTMITQRIFREVERSTQHKHKLVSNLGKYATVCQNSMARVAYEIIGEDSQFSKRKTYKGVSGAYAFIRFGIPLGLAIGYELTEHWKAVEEKKKSDKEKSNLEMSLAKLKEHTKDTNAKFDEMKDELTCLKIRHELSLWKREHLESKTAKEIMEAISKAKDKD